MTLSFQTDRSGQTVQTQIKLLLEGQSDQGLHCLQFPLHLLDASLYGKAALFQLYGDYSNLFGCPNILEFYGNLLIIIHDSIEPVSYGQNSTIFELFAYCVLYEIICFHVDRSCRFV